VFHTKVVGKIRTQIFCSGTDFRISCLVWHNVEKYSRAGEATDDDMVHAHCTLGTKGCRHTLMEYAIILALVLNNGYTNEPQRYVIRAVAVVVCCLCTA
jgi:hypothetical protein